MRRGGLLAAAAVAAALGAAWWAHEPRPGGAPAARDAGVSFQCPMHPHVVSGEAGRCPVCGMSLARVEAAPAADPAEDHGHDSHAAFALSPDRVQAIGVRTAAVEFRELHRDVHTAGTVAFDPDLYAALVAYRDAVRAPPESTGDASRMLEKRRALAVRLHLLGLAPGQVDALFEAGADPASLLLPGRSAWVYGEVYEAATDVRPGQVVRVTAPALSGREFRGEVVTVDSVGGPTSNRARVRALVATPGGGLRAEAFVRLVIEVPFGRRLAVPEDAVLDTGRRQLVFVHDAARGRFEPRDVVLGREAEAYHEILAGVAPGERVVTAANFLIDSESRLRAALAAYGAGSPPAP